MPPEGTDAWADVIQPLELSRPSLVGSFPPPHPRRRRWMRLAVRFLLIVLLPTLLTGGYFGFVAVDRYGSDAKFLVRKPNGLNPAAQTLSIDEGPKGISSDDSYAVRDFMLSRDAVRLLLDKADLRAAAERAGRDPFWRFPGWLNGASDEELYEFYLSMVSVDYESSTGVTNLHVEAFRPDDAQRLATVLINGAEALLNRLNERARTDAVQLATAEVARNRSAALVAEDRLTAFRERESVIDPTKYSETILATIGTLSMQLVDTAAQLDVTMQATPRSPQIAPLRGRVRALQGQIDNERVALAGGDMSLAPKIADYERLVLTRDFAQRSLISALDLLQVSRLDVLRQQAYLEPVVEPGLADKARYPRGILWTVCVLVAGLTVFMLFRPTGPASARAGRRMA
jgi:capsular polysaccharide transport system permease protein